MSPTRIIPQPTEQRIAGSAAPFTLIVSSRILATDAAASVAGYLAGILRPSTGYPLPIVSPVDGDVAGPADIALHLDLADSSSLGAEGYTLATSEAGASITAATPAGLFYGVQSFRQLLPPEVEKHSVQSVAWQATSATLTDRPRFAWRGAMLDVARHFFSVPAVKRYIDEIVLFKINTLHLHLTDDQGWRISIPGRQELTGIGASTAVGGGSGGFYTEEDFASIVRYAADRFVTIVPEIDVPGHTQAAIAAYPEIGLPGSSTAVYTGMEVGFSSLDVHADATWQFLDDVFRSVASQTPGPYLHIGGDESHTTPPEEFPEFIARATALVAAHGKIPIAWHEAGRSEGLAPGTIGQYWDYATPERNGAELAASFIEQGGSIIFSPADVSYLDITYDESTPIGQAWAGGPTTVQSAYEWEPTDVLLGVPEDRMLGVEAPLWTETVVTSADIDYLAFPRLAAVAEIGWSNKDNRTWADFSARLALWDPRFTALGIAAHRDDPTAGLAPETLE
ncbi:beta-N-acetylhexosaminidase [Mycetocola manganoxydans]|nr:beta-N-acetylhexosaminidase [Mycetocola manganoxydans]GHD47856.1 beta-N-acetylhexosaminidase [Mycetocola manganoxydans]